MGKKLPVDLPMRPIRVEITTEAYQALTRAKRETGLDYPYIVSAALLTFRDVHLNPYTPLGDIQDHWAD